ncbi:MAG: hypothetical protein SP1CHLAM54_01750 [Chlamydiia bacterium]|nr:hypothetical protein [Chlamydiia bacterium]MCH9615093.1 hypothetical protein [Chlamydiia bacterium]MCH9628585.1 hypothetical protein [Chlamydiia bacterium]
MSIDINSVTRRRIHESLLALDRVQKPAAFKPGDQTCATAGKVTVSVLTVMGSAKCLQCNRVFPNGKLCLSNSSIDLVVETPELHDWMLHKQVPEVHKGLYELDIYVLGM